MIICVDNYYEDITYNGIRTFLSYGRIGLCHLENGNKTLPSFHCVIFSDKCVFVEVDGKIGIIGLDLSLIVSPVYKDILSVNQIDRDVFISSCISNPSAVSVTLDSNGSSPTHIAIQTNTIDANNKIEGLRLTSYNEYEEEDKACIYEVTDSLEDAETGLFVTISDNEFQLINIDDFEMMKISGFKGYEFLPLWHYKDNMFIIRNNNGTYVTSTYKDGRFTKKSLFGEYNDGFDEEGSPRIVVHRNEFVSVCYPRNYRITGFPNTKQFQDKENAFHEKCGKWALFKYFHKKIEEDDKRWHMFLSNEKTCFEQLTSFAFEEPMTQLQDDNEFICHGDGMDFLMRFEQKVAEKFETLTLDEKYKTKPCSQGQLNIIACYNTIELREDGLYDVSTEDGYGLCDKDMQVIVPAKYDYPIECGEYLMIGVKNSSLLNDLKRYGYFVAKSSKPILTSEDLTDDILYLNGNSSEGFCDLEEIIITKDVGKVEWNGLGRYRFRRFKVVPENKIFCEVDGVLYTRKGYDREGDTHRKQMIELVACPTNVPTHIVMPGTKRIANCAFKGSMIETLQLPDTLEEIGVNAFYLTPNLKYLKLPMSIRKIYAQDVGKSGDISPQIEYETHRFNNWEELYEYMLKNGFKKNNGNIVRS